MQINHFSVSSSVPRKNCKTDFLCVYLYLNKYICMYIYIYIYIYICVCVCVCVCVRVRVCVCVCISNTFQWSYGLFSRTQISFACKHISYSFGFRCVFIVLELIDMAQK